jgi:hypothetical protein
MVLLRTSARPPTHENNHRKVRNPGREGSGPAVKEIDFIKIDVEGHELQGDEIAEAETEVVQGKCPNRPFLLLSQPTLFDPRRAPAGRHVVWVLLSRSQWILL